MTARVERLVVIGGGGFGREVIQFGHDCHRAGGPRVGGYLDDGGEVLARLGYNLPWLGSVAEYQPREGDRLVVAIGDAAGKRKVVDLLKTRGAQFPPLIHPTALVTGRTSLGEGAIFGPFTGSGVDTRIGRFVSVNSYSGFGHDSSAGDFTTLSAHVDIMGSAVLGADVFIGSKACVLPGVRIGDGARVGAGAIVYRSVPAGRTAYAAPAKLLKTR